MTGQRQVSPTAEALRNSLLAETSASGQVQARFAAYPYGLTRQDTATQTRRYAGATRDTSVGLDLMGLSTSTMSLLIKFMLFNGRTVELATTVFARRVLAAVYVELTLGA